MTGRKPIPKDHVEQVGRELAKGDREGSVREIADADRARALTRPLRLPDGAEEKAAERVAEWATDDADKARLLQMLGLAPTPARPAVVTVPKRISSRPQMTGQPTRQQQLMAGRVAVFAAHLEAGLNWRQAAKEMEISRKTALRYAEAVSGTGGAS